MTARPAARRSAQARADEAAATALQAALAAENSAVYGYGVAGAHLAGAKRATAVRNWLAHQHARDVLTAMLAARGVRPVAAAAAYALPFAVHNAAAAVALATVLEDRVSSAYLGLVGLTDPALRAFGARAVRVAALRAAAWRGGTLAFPGLDVPVPRHRGVPTAGRATASPNPSPGGPTPSHPG